MFIKPSQNTWSLKWLKSRRNKCLTSPRHVTSVTILWMHTRLDKMVTYVVIFVDRGSWCFDIMLHFTVPLVFMTHHQATFQKASLPENNNNMMVVRDIPSQLKQQNSPCSTGKWLKTRNTMDTDMWLDKCLRQRGLTSIINLQLQWIFFCGIKN